MSNRSSDFDTKYINKACSDALIMRDNLRNDAVGLRVYLKKLHRERTTVANYDKKLQFVTELLSHLEAAENCLEKAQKLIIEEKKGG